MSDPDRPSDLQLVIGVSRDSLALGSLKQVLPVNVYREDSRAWLLLAQLPSSPSSARAALRRRLHAIGAAGVLNGSWALPHTAAHVQFFEQLQGTVRKQGGESIRAGRFGAISGHGHDDREAIPCRPRTGV
jgi:hypothetical protein